MVRLAAACAVWAWAALAPTAAESCRLALLLAVDVSSSIDRREYDLQRDGLADALIAPEVVAAFFSSPVPVALAAFEWSSDWNQRTILAWRMIESPEDLGEAAREIRAFTRGPTGFPTAIGQALRRAHEEFDGAPACLRQTLDVSGDGRNNHGPTPGSAYQDHDFAGITVNALAIGGAMSLDDLVAYFRRELIRGPNAFVEVASDHKDFERAMRRKLEREVSTRMVSQLDPRP